MSTIPQPEAFAAKALRDYLLRKLPAACASINALRAASLVSPLATSFTVPVAAVLKLSLQGKGGTFTDCALTSGTRTAAEVVSDINAAMGATVATVDAQTGQVVLTSTTSPSFSGVTGTDSAIAVAADTTGANIALGFDPGGEWAVTSALVPPTPLGVADGFPAGGFFMPAAIGKGRVVITIGERQSQLRDGNPRRHEYNVVLDVAVFRSEPNQQSNQSREGIQAALRAVRACLCTDEGKQLGNPSFASASIVIAREQSASVSPWAFRQQRQGDSTPSGLLFDAATMKLAVLVFEQPPIT